MLNLSDRRYETLPRVTEQDRNLYFSNIYTPEVRIESINSREINNYWEYPSEWYSQIKNRLEELAHGN